MIFLHEAFYYTLPCMDFSVLLLILLKGPHWTINTENANMLTCWCRVLVALSLLRPLEFL